VIRFRCERCGKTLNVEDHAAGQAGTCGGCGTLITAPASSVRRTESWPMRGHPVATVPAPSRPGVRPDTRPGVRSDPRPDLWPADDPERPAPADDEVLELPEEPPTPARPTPPLAYASAPAVVRAAVALAGVPSADATNWNHREITEAATWLRGFAAVLTIAGAIQLAVGGIGLLASIPGTVRAWALMHGLQFRTGVLMCLTYGGAASLVLVPVLRMIAAAGLVFRDLANRPERGRYG